MLSRAHKIKLQEARPIYMVYPTTRSERCGEATVSGSFTIMLNCGQTQPYIFGGNIWIGTADLSNDITKSQ